MVKSLMNFSPFEWGYNFEVILSVSCDVTKKRFKNEVLRNQCNENKRMFRVESGWGPLTSV